MSYIATHAESHPDKPAIIMAGNGNTTTFRELNERSARIANLLHARGVGSGASIAMLMKNQPQFLEVAWAAQRSGQYYTPISTRLTPPEAAYIISDCDATVLVVSRELIDVAAGALDILKDGDVALPGTILRLSTGNANTAEATGTTNAGTGGAVDMAGTADTGNGNAGGFTARNDAAPGGGPGGGSGSGGSGSGGSGSGGSGSGGSGSGESGSSGTFEPYETLLENEVPTVSFKETEGQDMLYSSGTTGKPKGVRLPLPQTPMGGPHPMALLAQGLYKIDSTSVYLSPAPLYHAAPLRFTMAALRLGATTVIMDRFDPIEFLSTIERYGVTHAQVVPTMLVRLLKMPERDRRQFDLSSLQCVLHAAAPCPVEVKRQIIEWVGPVVYEYYAGTEGNGFCAIDSEEWLAHPGSVGRSLLGRIHILDQDGVELVSGQIGTIYFENPVPFSYHKDPQKTATSRNGKGWTTLGDIGYIDDEGYLYLTDRKAFMIVTGGVNVYPQEAENLLITHPAVMDAAVFGIPNEEFGEEVKAVVQPIDMANAGKALENELISFLKSKLADVKCPRSIDFEPDLPRHPNGKLYKQQLRDKYWKGHHSRII
ncbi:MAG: AMP-binding protein [Acidimicrobiales bacterium]